MSVEGIPVGDLHQELKQTTPNSEEEKAILDKLRDRREHKTGEFRAVRNTGLEQTAEHGVVDPTAAQRIVRRAIEQVTGEHEIPTELIGDPGQIH